MFAGAMDDLFLADLRKGQPILFEATTRKVRGQVFCSIGSVVQGYSFALVIYNESITEKLSTARIQRYRSDLGIQSSLRFFMAICSSEVLVLYIRVATEAESISDAMAMICSAARVCDAFPIGTSPFVLIMPGHKIYSVACDQAALYHGV